MGEPNCICQVCGQEFYRCQYHISKGAGKYCSLNCRYSVKPIPNRICKVCGKQFFAKKSRILRWGAFYCSKDCANIGQRKGDIYRCKRCGKEFYTTKSNKNRGNGKYCSKSCTAGGPKVKKICRECGEEFYIISSWAKIGRGKYCSAECAFKNRDGYKNPRWLGGKSFEPYCIKFNENIKEIVRENFNRRCFICNIEERDRHHAIHHIDYNKNTLCNGNKWALLPLCHSHHCATNHKRYFWFNLLINYWVMNQEINLQLGSKYGIYPYSLVRT